MNGLLGKVGLALVAQTAVVLLAVWRYSVEVSSDIGEMRSEIRGLGDSRASKEELGRVDERLKFIEGLIQIRPVPLAPSDPAPWNGKG